MTELRIEVVRGRMTDERAEAILACWRRAGAADDEAARERLDEVVCVLLEGDEVVGLDAVVDAPVALIGGRRFWRYRRFLAPDAAEAAGDDADTTLLAAAFDALDEAFDPEGDGPIGLCVVVDDPEIAARHPEAVWPATELLFAGYDADGREVRIRYFAGALVE